MRAGLPLVRPWLNVSEDEMAVVWVEYINALVIAEELDASTMFDEAIHRIADSNLKTALDRGEIRQNQDGDGLSMSEDVVLSASSIEEVATAFAGKYLNGSSDGVDQFVALAALYAQGFDLMELEAARQGLSPRWQTVYGPKSTTRVGRGQQRAARSELRKEWSTRSIAVIRDESRMYVLWRYICPSRTLDEALRLTWPAGREAKDYDEWKSHHDTWSSKLRRISRLLGHDLKLNQYGKWRNE